MVAAVRPVGDCGIEAIEFCIRSPWLARPTPYDSRELIRFIEAIDKTGMNRIVRCFHPIKTCAPCANQSYPDEYQCVSFHIFSFIPTLQVRLRRLGVDSLELVVGHPFIYFFFVFLRMPDSKVKPILLFTLHK